MKKRKAWGAIMSSGFFPEELPPCFTTKDLDAVFNNIAFPNRVLEARKDDNGHKVNLTGKLLSFSIPRINPTGGCWGFPHPFTTLNYRAALSKIPKKLWS
ncbi:MAG: hypothetical protein ABWZ25_04090 [Chitinophagaceae bacterium]